MMLKRLSRVVSPPLLNDEEDMRLNRLLHVVLFILIGGLVIVNFITLFVLPERAGRLPISQALLLLAVGDLLLARRGYVRQAALLFACSLWVLLTLAAFATTGVESNSFGGYLIVIVFSGLLIGRRAAYAFAVLSFLSGLVMLQVDSTSVLPFDRIADTSNSTFLIYSVYFLVAAGLLHVASTSIREGLARARRGEDALAERNRELQEEITERKRVEKALRASDTQLRLALEAARMRAWYWDIQADTMRTSGSVAPDLELPTSSIITSFENWLTGLHPADVPTIRKVINQAIDDDEPYLAEFRKLLADGSYAWIESVGKVWRDEAGKAISMVGVSHNITDRKQAEKHRLELAVQAERLAFLTDFMSNMSHDLRTPLTVLKTSMYLMERLEDPEQIQKRLPIMQSQVELVERYIEDILTISRLDYIPELTLETANLNQLVEDAELRLRPETEKKHQTVNLQLDPAMPQIMVDTRQFDHIFLNLIENACNYTPERGEIIIRTLFQENEVVLEIQDTGIGIPEADIPLIFDRFYRGGNARMAHRAGTGLGLAIVNKIVEMHRGVIELDSVVDKGTTFRVRLPYQPQPDLSTEWMRESHTAL